MMTFPKHFMDSTRYFWNLFFTSDNFQKGFAILKVAEAELNEHKHGSKCVGTANPPKFSRNIYYCVL